MSKALDVINRIKTLEAKNSKADALSTKISKLAEELQRSMTLFADTASDTKVAKQVTQQMVKTVGEMRALARMIDENL
jgi:hypothetical protein